MALIHVDDPDDPRLAPLRTNERGLTNRLQKRDDRGDGLFMAEGDLVVERALDAGCRPVLALVDGARPPAVTERLAGFIDVHAGGERLRAAVTRLGMPYSVVALFERPARPTPSQLADGISRLIVAEAVDNPVNVGSIVRNGLALGWQGLLLDTTSADPLARRSLRVSMGHALHLPHARTTDLPAAVGALVAAGWMVVALTPSDVAVDLTTLTPAPRTALMVGSERAGLSDTMLGLATHQARIPMSCDVDSLNAAAATAIACWHLR